MLKPVEGFWYVVWNMCVKCALVIVPPELDTYKQFSFPVNCDAVVLLEGFDEVVGVSVTCELDSKVVNGKSEGDRAPCAPPKSRLKLNMIIS